MDDRSSEGCSNCALSFCRRCLPHRAILPQLANKPVTVCSQCFDKLNAETLKNQSRNGTQITRIAIEDHSQLPSSSVSNARSSSWWGDGLPPPSLRQSVGLPPTRILRGNVRTYGGETERSGKDARDLEERWKKSRQDGARFAPQKLWMPAGISCGYNVLASLINNCLQWYRFFEFEKSINSDGQPLTLSQIEERLAALRGCDVELIRRPRCMFESSGKQLPTGDSVQSLMEMAKERAKIEERHDPANELERRHRALREEQEKLPCSNSQQDRLATTDAHDASDCQSDPRLSTVSSSTAFSEATAKELADINSLLEDAKKRVNASEADEKVLQREMKSVMAATRQKSLDIEKVTNELGHFWNKQLDKVELSDSDEESLDDETVKKIILEAEQAVEDHSDDKPAHSSEGGAPKSTEFTATVQSPSPKKPGLFSKIFRR